MKNEYGLEVDYFTKKLARIIRDLHSYKKEELARELARCALTAKADKTVEEVDRYCQERNLQEKIDKSTEQAFDATVLGA